MADEPAGHRGHPSWEETDLADRLRPHLQAAMWKLEWEGILDAVRFGGELLWLIANEKGKECWTDVYSATSTLKNVLDGRSAKLWSLEYLEELVNKINYLLQ